VTGCRGATRRAGCGRRFRSIIRRRLGGGRGRQPRPDTEVLGRRGAARRRRAARARGARPARRHRGRHLARDRRYRRRLHLRPRSGQGAHPIAVATDQRHMTVPDGRGDALVITSYRTVFRYERRLYRIDRWRLPAPAGVPLRSLLYAPVVATLLVLA